MNRYLLDTNHLSAYLDRHPVLETRIDAGLSSGDRFGIALPILCEYRAGVVLSRRHQRNMGRLRAAMTYLRFWPADQDTASEFAKLLQELNSAGKRLSQFDHMIAAIARQHQLTLLTADSDFQGVPGLGMENWLT